MDNQNLQFVIFIVNLAKQSLPVVFTMVTEGRGLFCIIETYKTSKTYHFLSTSYFNLTFNSSHNNPRTYRPVTVQKIHANDLGPILYIMTYLSPVRPLSSVCYYYKTTNSVPGLTNVSNKTMSIDSKTLQLTLLHAYELSTLIN